jgi:hypothetical protein
MQETEEQSQSIDVADLGMSVLNLSEVVQTFDKESTLYNIRLKEQEENRTVLLAKNIVEVAGETKLILMVRDVTANVKLEEEQVK